MLLKKQMLTAFFLFFPAAYTVAEIQVVPVAELVPQQKHIKVNDLVAHILTSRHYKEIKFNDGLSGVIYENYLEGLDRNKAFFLKSDINEFEKYRYKIDDAIVNSQLEPAYEIFKRYRQRVAERVRYAIKALENDFNFDIDESYRFDRRNDDWQPDTRALDELWRKRVKNDLLNLKLADKDNEDIRKTLRERYQRIKTSAFQLNSNDVFQSFINAYTSAIEPHTAYFSPRVSENFDISMRLSLEGIGAVLRSESEYTQVVKVIAGGPADISGQIKAGDRIIGVGQDKDSKIIDVIGWRLDNVVDLIRGPKGTVINLEILPKGAGPSKKLTLIRDKVKLEEQSAAASVIELPESETRIGVIDLPAFYIDFAARAAGKKDYKSTTRDVIALIKSLRGENIDGLIIDLRGNGGGSLAEALELTGLFIDRGPIVQTKDASGRVDINYDPQPGVMYAGPLAVLVDRDSASASEIFAGAIQDYRRGIIIGEPTFGKGTVQNVIDLNRFISSNDVDYGRLKITIAQFFRVSGGSNQYEGVTPDIIFPTAEDSSEQGERAYKNALSWGEVKPASYKLANAPIDDFKIVRNQHQKRIQEDELFQLMMEDIYLQREIVNEKEISLLEKTRRERRERMTTTQKNVQNAMRFEKGLPPLEENEEAPETGEEDPIVDILLNETAKILGDLIVVPDEGGIDTRTVDIKRNAVQNISL